MWKNLNEKKPAGFITKEKQIKTTTKKQFDQLQQLISNADTFSKRPVIFCGKKYKILINTITTNYNFRLKNRF